MAPCLFAPSLFRCPLFVSFPFSLLLPSFVLFRPYIICCLRRPPAIISFCFLPLLFNAAFHRVRGDPSLAERLGGTHVSPCGAAAGMDLFPLGAGHSSYRPIIEPYVLGDLKATPPPPQKKGPSSGYQPACVCCAAKRAQARRGVRVRMDG